MALDRQATQEPSQDSTGNGQGKGGSIKGQEEVEVTGFVLVCAWSKEDGEAYSCVPTSYSWEYKLFQSRLDDCACKTDLKIPLIYQTIFRQD